jgi:hypothetical protein
MSSSNKKTWKSKKRPLMKKYDIASGLCMSNSNQKGFDKATYWPMIQKKWHFMSKSYKKHTEKKKMADDANKWHSPRRVHI